METSTVSGAFGLVVNRPATSRRRSSAVPCAWVDDEGLDRAPVAFLGVGKEIRAEFDEALPEVTYAVGGSSPSSWPAIRSTTRRGGC